MNIFGEDENNHPLWYQITDVQDQHHIQNMKFREVMLTVNKLIPDVKNCKYLQNEKCILFQSLKKHRQDLCSKNLLGNIPCVIKERIKLNTVKGTINHHSISETNEADLLEDLKSDNSHIVDVFIFKKFSRELNKKINTSSAVVTFDLLSLPPQIKYLKYTILKTRLYYPNPMRCLNCYRYGHLNTRDRPCSEQKICGKCSDLYHLNENEICTRPTNCSNCNGAHEAWSIKCPKFKDEKRKVEIMTDNRCSYKEANKIFENQDNRIKQFSAVAAEKKAPNVVDKNFQKCDEKLDKIMEFLTEKMEKLMSVIITALPHLGRPISPPGEWVKSQMNIVEETDSAGEMDEDDESDEYHVSPTPNQPTVQGAHYYTADYSNRGNNNPPAKHNRSQKRQSEKLKEKDTKKKK